MLRLLAVLVPALLLAGCTDDGSSPSPSSSPSSPPPASSPSPTAVVSPERPEKSGCHRLSYDEAIAPVVVGTDVPCRQRHTSQTFEVGRLDLVSDGHLLAVDSPDVQDRVARRCTSRLGRHVGGTAEEVRLSMVQAVWFTPSVEEAASGADWYRCDVVALAGEGELLALPRSSRGMLASSDRFAMCGTAAPRAASFERVPCGVGDPSWRAVATVDLPGSAYPTAAQAGSRMESACRAAARSRADDPLDFTWSEERPTRAQWNAGQRYGICWAPD
ncbi:septum formation family protein [Nocardioides sediminis]|uniref:septum formation family protein n=1 Tax=Nocardioides sediminis TaxID=433648 RepID=UPI000D2FD5A9|nr:septum formation family protein [Nocardioides sediminis]